MILAILVAPYWDDLAILLSKRSNLFQLFENGSLINTFLFLGRLISTTFHLGETLWAYALSYAVILYAILLSALMLADYKLSREVSPQQQLVNTLLYFPFMVALPKSVYHYEFVVLLPLLPVLDYLWKKHCIQTTTPDALGDRGGVSTQSMAGSCTLYFDGEYSRLLYPGAGAIACDDRY